MYIVYNRYLFIRNNIMRHGRISCEFGTNQSIFQPHRARSEIAKSGQRVPIVVDSTKLRRLVRALFIYLYVLFSRSSIVTFDVSVVSFLQLNPCRLNEMLLDLFSRFLQFGDVTLLVWLKKSGCGIHYAIKIKVFILFYINLLTGLFFMHKTILNNIANLLDVCMFLIKNKLHE